MKFKILVRKFKAVFLPTFVLVNLLEKVVAEECTYNVRVNGKEGVIASPNFPEKYPPRKDCSWKFITSPGYKIQLFFDYFDIEEEPTCAYDFVAIYDGHTMSDPRFGKFCGNKIPPPIPSTTEKMLMIFHSDGAEEATGFRVTYKIDNMHDLLPNEGFVTSLNYPQNYENGETHFYKIETTVGKQIKLVFDFFELEAHEKCYYDSIAIYDGHTVNNTLLGTFCGNKIPSSIITSANKMLMVFRSDVSIVFKGFRAKYTSESSIKSITGVIEAERNLTQYLLSSRRKHTRSINKWGIHLPRTTVALFLSDRRFFAPDNKIGEEISYELSFQLMKMLSLNTITTQDLTLYINALIVTCINLKDTFRHNIVNELRKRANYNNRTVTPYSLLTLCNAKDTMTTFDVSRIQVRDYSFWQQLPTDTQAMGVMALSCVYYRSTASVEVKILAKQILDETIPVLKRKQQLNGSFGNIKTTALVVQALLASENYHSGFILNAAIKFILQEMSRTSVKIEDVHYILPLLNSMTLVNINSDHCIMPVETDSNVMRGHSNKYIETQISVVIGDNKDFSQTWKIKVPLNSTYYEALEKFSSLEPDYKAYYTLDPTFKKPYLTGLGNYHDNSEDGLIWYIYTRSLISKDNWQFHLKSPADIRVKENEKLILWYRSQLKT